jgi:hypothetical protein
MKKINAGIIILLILVFCTCFALCISPITNDQPLQNKVSATSETIPPLIRSDSGKPCTSNEAWHAKADQIGFWSGGILVEQSMTDEEIFTMLAQHNLSNREEVIISAPHHVGYYLSVNESRDRPLLNDLKTSQSRWNVSFSSPMYAFFSPKTKARGENVEIPVFLSYSGKMNESLLYENLISRGIPIQKINVVELGYFPSLDVAGKERLLNDLNKDEHVLFAFKEYLEGDIC